MVRVTSSDAIAGSFYTRAYIQKLAGVTSLRVTKVNS
jgi:hypothetical protein